MFPHSGLGRRASLNGFDKIAKAPALEKEILSTVRKVSCLKEADAAPLLLLPGLHHEGSLSSLPFNELRCNCFSKK
jgi:hypothetical protein